MTEEAHVDMTSCNEPSNLWVGSVRYLGDDRYMLVKRVKKFSHRAFGTSFTGYGPILDDASRAKAVAKYNARADVVAYRAEINKRANRVLDSGL